MPTDYDAHIRSYPGGDGLATYESASLRTDGKIFAGSGFDPQMVFVTVQTGAPTPDYLTPFIYDDTAVTGGLYAWDGNSYEKVGNLVA